MKKLQSIALATVLGFAVSAPLFAADTSRNTENNRSAAWSDAQVNTALDACNSLPQNSRGKCIVNIRPMTSGQTAAMTWGSSYYMSSEANSVKDGNARAEQERTAAVEQCQTQDTADMDRCVNSVTQRFGRT